LCKEGVIDFNNNKGETYDNTIIVHG